MTIKDVSGSEPPLRWIDAVRRSDPTLSIKEAAEVGEIYDGFSKRSVAEGYKLLAIKVDEDGTLDLRSPILRKNGL